MTAKQDTYIALTTLPGGVSAGTVVEVDPDDEQVKRHISAGLLEPVKGAAAKTAQPADLSPSVDAART